MTHALAAHLPSGAYAPQTSGLPAGPPAKAFMVEDVAVSGLIRIMIPDQLSHTELGEDGEREDAFFSICMKPIFNVFFVFECQVSSPSYPIFPIYTYSPMI